MAGFTGATNHIAGRVLKVDGDFGTIEAGTGMQFRAVLPAGASEGASVKVALRPDNVHFNPHGEGLNRFMAEVVSQRYQGVQTVYELKLPAGRIEAVDGGSSARYPVGSSVRIAIPPEACWAYASDAEPRELS